MKIVRHTYTIQVGTRAAANILKELGVKMYHAGYNNEKLHGFFHGHVVVGSEVDCALREKFPNCFKD